MKAYGGGRKLAFVLGLKMELRIEFVGDIVERQELLNGTQMVTLEGESADGAWSLVGDISWNVGLVDFSGEGDITLSRDDGTELLATLVSAIVTEIGDTELQDADHQLHATYEIDGGSGDFEAAVGSVAADGVLAGGTFRVTLTISLRAAAG